MVATTRISRLTRLAFVLSALAPTLLHSPIAKAVHAYELPPTSWEANSFGASVTGEYFFSNANYDQKRGSYTRLPGGNNFSNFTTHVRGRYGLTRSLGGFLSAGYARTQVEDAFGTRSGTSLTDLSAGFDYILTRRWIKLIAEGQAGYPMDFVEPGQTSPLTSEGVPFGRFGLFAFKPFRSVRLDGYFGLEYLGGGMASRALYQANIEFPLRKFLIGAGISGYEAITADQKSYAERISTAVLAGGSSLRYSAHEPALTEARAWIGFQPTKAIQARIGAAKTINGLRSAEGQSFVFALAFNGQDLFGPSVDELEEEAARGSSRGFKSDLEKHDQSLFQEEPPPAPPKKLAPKGPSAGESLDQTEKILERKK